MGFGVGVIVDVTVLVGVLVAVNIGFGVCVRVSVKFTVGVVNESEEVQPVTNKVIKINRITEIRGGFIFSLFSINNKQILPTAISLYHYIFID